MSDKSPPRRPGPKKPSHRKPVRDTAGKAPSSSGKFTSGKSASGRSQRDENPRAKSAYGKPDSRRSSNDRRQSDDRSPNRRGTESSGSSRAPWEKPAADRNAPVRKDRVIRGKPGSDAPRSERPRSDRPGTDRPRTDRPGNDRPGNDRPKSDRPRNDRPASGLHPKRARTTPARPTGNREVAPTASDTSVSAPLPPAPHIDGKDERIAKLLARAGVASRREIERMIADGRVALDGVVLETPATILTSLRGVTVDGQPVAAPERTRMFRFHKPSGLITAERDPTGRPTIYTALRNALPPGTPRLMPVGRLDINTEGLLLLTNDGELKRLLELPSTGVPRTYRARTFGDISQSQLEELIHGITIDGVHYGRIDANLERRTGRNQWIELTLTEGKNREVRRVLENLGLAVSRLMRTSYGPFVLDDLARGGALEVHREELARFQNSLRPRANNRNT